MSNEDILQEIKHKEEELELYKIKVFDVPLWRLVRFNVRVNKLNKETGFKNATITHKINKFLLLKNYIKSFIQIISLIIKHKKFENIVFAFPRLSKYNGIYFDKFTDPVIEQTNLNNNVLIVQRSLGGNHLSPRFNQKKIITSDFIDISSKVLGYILSPFFFIIHSKKVNSIYKKASTYFNINQKFKLTTIIRIGEFYFQYIFWKKFMSKIKNKNIMLVDREIFFPQIVACKKIKINSYELQHGITHSETALYTGTYQPNIDPDYFLTFGEKWINNYFAIPVNKIYNIGWAYKSWIINKLKENIKKDTILVISSPEITETIVQTTIELAKAYNKYTFILRLHPQEELTEKQENKLKNIDNIKIDSKEIDSLVSVLSCEYCIGENSSVLYEALDYEKPVAKIMYNGLGFSYQGEFDKDIKELFYLYSADDFKVFLQKKNITEYKKSTGIYDSFDKENLEQILSKKI